jgi:kanamycin kinase
VPKPIIKVSRGEPIVPVWVNGLGGLTFQIGMGPLRRFAKWAPKDSGIDLHAEVERLLWAVRFAKVPKVLDHGEHVDGSWMLTAGLPGQSAVSPRWKAEPAVAVRAAGVGLRELHEALPVEECPFDWSAERRLAEAAVIGLATDHLRDPPPLDRQVVCHGDACVPNTLIHDNGRFSGHVDLSALGTADRWADLAVATWSTEWNYGPGWEEPLLQAYGIAADPARIEYYRCLWDLESPV